MVYHYCSSHEDQAKGLYVTMCMCSLMYKDEDIHQNNIHQK